MISAYTSLAEWFEYLNADCDYEKWSQYLYNRLMGLGIRSGKGLDIGCGRGAFTRAFAGFGFDMTGYDGWEPVRACGIFYRMRAKSVSWADVLILRSASTIVSTIYRKKMCLRSLRV